MECYATKEGVPVPQKDKLNRPLVFGAFAMYLFLLIWVIALKFNAAWLPELGEYFRALPLRARVGKRIIPFYSMIKNGFYFEQDYFMNAVVYIPLGLFLPYLLPCRGRTARSLAIILLSSVTFEMIQLYTGFGGCDGTDVVCNLLGGVAGLLLVALLRRFVSDRAVNVVCALGLLAFAPITVYALVNTLSNLHLYRM